MSIEKKIGAKGSRSARGCSRRPAGCDCSPTPLIQPTSHTSTKMKPMFDAGYDVVICSRDSKDAPGARQAVPQPAFKRVLGNGANLIAQALAAPGIWDTQCGFKAFTDRAASRI